MKMSSGLWPAGRCSQSVVFCVTCVARHIASHCLPPKVPLHVNMFFPCRGLHRSPRPFQVVPAVLGLLLVAAAPCCGGVNASIGRRPNIVFLIDESTDGRTYRPDFEVRLCAQHLLFRLSDPLRTVSPPAHPPSLRPLHTPRAAGPSHKHPQADGGGSHGAV